MSPVNTAETQSVSITSKPTDTIILTPQAAEKVAQLLAAENDPALALRVAVRPGGCSGYQYDMFFDADKADDDLVTSFDCSSGAVRVFTDAVSAPMLKGATLDYKDALQGGGFAIENPNAQRSCGCGDSFC